MNEYQYLNGYDPSLIEEDNNFNLFWFYCLKRL